MSIQATQEFPYRFYKEVDVSKEPDSIFIDITSPWITKKMLFKKPVDKLRFSQIHDLPVYQILPRRSLLKKINFENKINPFFKLTRQELIECLQKKYSENFDISSTDTASISWSRKEIKEDSRIDNSDYFDPLSVCTAIQRRRFLNMLNFQTDKSLTSILIDLLREKEEEKFFRLVALQLYQSYYITKSSSYSLTPAIDNSFNASELVAEYVREEKGHHNLILLSLSELGETDKEKFIYFKETKAMMSLLHFFASENFLAFCCAICFFESGSFMSFDPLAVLLEHSSKPRSAIGLSKHFLINKKGDHGIVGLNFAQKINQPINEEEVDFVITGIELLEHMNYGFIRQVYATIS
jgi:hypothetical protein